MLIKCIAEEKKDKNRGEFVQAEVFDAPAEVIRGDLSPAEVIHLGTEVNSPFGPRWYLS